MAFDADEGALRRFLLLVVVGLVVGLVVQLAADSPPVRRIEDRAGDRRIRLWRQLSEADARGIVMVAVDDESLRALGLRWPLPRSVYARAIDALRRGGATVIGVAVLFEGASPNPVDDALLQRVLKSGQDVVLASDLDLTKSPPTLLQPTLPAPSGFSNVPADRDGVVRRFMVWPAGVSTPPPACLPLEMLRVSYQDPQFRARGFAGEPGATYPIAYAGPPGDTFRVVPLKRVLAGGDLTREVKGKLVLMGSTLDASVRTPFSGGMSSLEVLANVLFTLESSQQLETLSGLERWALTMALAFVLFQLFVRMPSPLAVFLAGGAMVLYLIGALYSMVFNLRLLPLVGPMAAIAAACATAVTYRFAEGSATFIRQVRRRRG